jgi:hypothetical protein
MSWRVVGESTIRGSRHVGRRWMHSWRGGRNVLTGNGGWRGWRSRCSPRWVSATLRYWTLKGGPVWRCGQ